MSLDEKVILLAAGDCGPVHGEQDGYPRGHFSSRIAPLFSHADLRIANCERQYSDRPQNGARTKHGCLPSHMAEVHREFGFDILTLANNHMMDAGWEAMLDTRATLEKLGIRFTGAGKNIAEAAEPVVMDCKGQRIGVLAYCSDLTESSAATTTQPGVSPLHVLTDYEERGPHVPVRIKTHPAPQDLQRIVDDVIELRKRVDHVVVSFHWGVIWVPRVISDYQRIVAHACIDAGADVIFGHHPHVLKGVEVYKGKPILYSLAHLCMTKPDPSPRWNEPPWMHGSLRNYQDLDPSRPLLPYGKDARFSMIAQFELARNAEPCTRLTPVLIDHDYRPVPLKAGDPEFSEAVRYIRWTSEGLPQRLEVEGNEIRVLSP